MLYVVEKGVREEREDVATALVSEMYNLFSVLHISFSPAAFEIFSLF